jgi:hypothetical protein
VGQAQKLRQLGVKPSKSLAPALVDGAYETDELPHGYRFRSFDWPTGLAGGPSTFLIFDESDEIALPFQQHTEDRSEVPGFTESCAGRVQHLQGHYYVCTF